MFILQQELLKKQNIFTWKKWKRFYSYLSMEGITDADYAHAKGVCKDSEIRNLGKHHDLYAQSDTLLLAEVSEDFWNTCLKIYEHDPAHFLTAP